jgi:hypothetical protein
MTLEPWLEPWKINNGDETALHQPTRPVSRLHPPINRPCSAPGQARSIALPIPPQELRPFYGSYATTNIPPPARRDHTQQPTDTEAALLRLGKMQPEDWFAPQGFPKMCELLPAPRRFSPFPWPGESLKPPFQSRSSHHDDAH